MSQNYKSEIESNGIYLTIKENADKLGRGLTTSCIWFDEFSFLSRNKIIYDACYPAWSTASQNAKENGTPYGITITTTPNDLNLSQAEFCYKMIEDSAKFQLKCFDMSDAELNDYIEKNSMNDFIYIVFTYQELGRSEEWFKKQCRGLNNDMAKIKRELLLEWPLTNDFSLFTESQLELVHKHLKPILYDLNVDGYNIKWYEQPDFKKNYIIGADVSGGLSRDSSTLVFVNPDDFSVAANFKNNKIDIENFKILIKTVMTQFFPNSFLVCEANSYGLAVLQSLMKDPKIEPRLLQEVREKQAERTTRDGFTIKKKTKTLNYGVDTTQASRKLMFEMLPSIVDEEFEKIVAEDLYLDLAGLERKKTGKIEHGDNTHDDTLMAYLIVRYSIFYGSYLRQRGISPIPSSANIKVNSNSDEMKKFMNLIDNANALEDRAMQVQSHHMEALQFQEMRFKEMEKKQINNNLNSFLQFLDN